MLHALQDLEALLEEEGLTLHRERLSNTLPSFCKKKQKAIVLDKGLSETEEIWATRHEAAHFHTGAFYTLDTPLETWGRCEAKAKQWVILTYVPAKAIKQVLASGLRAYWEIAEELDVPEEILRYAMDYYSRNGLL